MITPLTDINAIYKIYNDVIDFIALNNEIGKIEFVTKIGIRDVLTPFWDFTKFPEYLIKKVLEIKDLTWNQMAEFVEWVRI